MKEESLLLLSDLQKLINQVVLIDYTIIILGGKNVMKSQNNMCVCGGTFLVLLFEARRSPRNSLLWVKVECQTEKATLKSLNG